MDIPAELDGAKVLRYATISDGVEPTAATRHVVQRSGRLKHPVVISARRGNNR